MSRRSPTFGGAAAGGAVVIAASEHDVGHTLGNLRLFLVLAGIAAAALAAIAVFLLQRRALRPVTRLAAAAAEVERTGDARRRLPLPPSNDEVGRLANTLNEMLGEPRALTRPGAALPRRRLARVAHAVDGPPRQHHVSRTPRRNARAAGRPRARCRAARPSRRRSAGAVAGGGRVHCRTPTFASTRSPVTPPSVIRAITVDAPESVTVRGERRLARARARQPARKRTHPRPGGRRDLASASSRTATLRGSPSPTRARASGSRRNSLPSSASGDARPAARAPASGSRSCARPLSATAAAPTPKGRASRSSCRSQEPLTAASVQRTRKRRKDRREAVFARSRPLDSSRS